MKILSLFTHVHVDLNLHDIFSNVGYILKIFLPIQ